MGALGWGGGRVLAMLAVLAVLPSPPLPRNLKLATHEKVKHMIIPYIRHELRVLTVLLIKVHHAPSPEGKVSCHPSWEARCTCLSHVW